MRRRLILAALVFAGSATTWAGALPIPSGDRLTLPSKVLGEEREILVSLPDGYARSDARYPVLCVTDGQWHFSHVRTTAAFLARNSLMPDVIVVGIPSPDRTRDLYATLADFRQDGRTIPFPRSGHADEFLEFIEKELVPWTESTYRTLPLRVLMGHSAGGNFAFHAMRLKPALFQAVVAASPWLAWDDRKELSFVVPFLKSANVKTRSLFFSSADEGPEMLHNLGEVTRALESSRTTSLRWSSSAYPAESHDSSVLKSFYDGLRATFAGWELPRDPATRALIGSLEDAKAHYAALGERFGVALLPPESVVNELGYRYLQAGRVDSALATLQYGAATYPHSANVWDSLADALERAGKVGEAVASAQKAATIGRENGDPNLEAYRQHVVRLESLLTPGGR